MGKIQRRGRGRGGATVSYSFLTNMKVSKRVIVMSYSVLTVNTVIFLQLSQMRCRIGSQKGGHQLSS